MSTAEKIENKVEDNAREGLSAIHDFVKRLIGDSDHLLSAEQALEEEVPPLTSISEHKSIKVEKAISKLLKDYEHIIGILGSKIHESVVDELRLVGKEGNLINSEVKDRFKQELRKGLSLKPDLNSSSDKLNKELEYYEAQVKSHALSQEATILDKLRFLKSQIDSRRKKLKQVFNDYNAKIENCKEFINERVAEKNQKFVSPAILETIDKSIKSKKEEIDRLTDALIKSLRSLLDEFRVSNGELKTLVELNFKNLLIFIVTASKQMLEQERATLKLVK